MMLLKSVVSTLEPPALMGFGHRVANYLEDRTVERFSVEGDSDSGNWAPLTTGTQRIRAALGYGPSGPINIRTSELFMNAVYTRSVTTVGLNEMNVEYPSLSKMSDVALIKLKHAQFGVPVGSNPLFPNSATPPRPVIAAGKRDLEAIVKLLQIHVMSRTTSAVASGFFA